MLSHMRPTQPSFLPRYSSLMVYKLPREDVQPLSQAFFKLETGKRLVRDRTLGSNTYRT